MYQNILIAAMQFVGFTGAATFVCFMIAANIYDLRHAKAKHATSTRKRRPTVSVVVVADARSGPLAATLDSVRMNGYKNIEVIAADNASHTGVRRIVSAYSKRYDGLQLYGMVKHKSTDLRNLIIDAMERYGSGDYVVWLRAGDTIEHGVISKLVTRLDQHGPASIIRPRSILCTQLTLGATLKAYQLMLDDTLLKSFSVMHAYHGLGERGCTGARAMNEHPAALKSVFAPDIAVTDGSPWNIARFYRENTRRVGTFYRRHLSVISMNGQTYRRALIPGVLLNGITGLLLPLVLCYFLYLAFYLLQPVFLAVSIAVAVIILLYCIWGEYSLSVIARLRYSVGIPITFLAYFILSFVPIIALFGIPAED